MRRLQARGASTPRLLLAAAPGVRFAWSTTVGLRWLRYYVTGCLWKYSAKDVANAIEGSLAANITAERTITAKHTNFATG